MASSQPATPARAQRVPVETLNEFCVAVLRQCGLGDADARCGAAVLVTTDSWGTLTHGTKLLSGYVNRLRGGGLKPTGKPHVVREGPAWAIIDGDSALGLVISCFAMETAIAKAKTAGVGYVSVFNSCHFGAAGYYANLAVDRDMVGLAMANDSPSVTAPGSRAPALGSNPFAFAAPAGEEWPILLDIATAAVAGGKVYMSSVLGKPIPNNWIVDRDGVPTTNASLYPHNASLLPMAGHKGYGLALMIETLAGLMSGGALTNQIASWMFADPSLPTGHTHAFVALNVGAMVPLAQYKKRMDDLIHEIRSLPKAKGSDRIYLPGEMEWERREQALREGILLPPDVTEKLIAMVGTLGMKMPAWLVA
jgi:LDH2 family malate/lactate/ureidoglycolate dehydrogenase